MAKKANKIIGLTGTTPRYRHQWQQSWIFWGKKSHKLVSKLIPVKQIRYAHRLPGSLALLVGFLDKQLRKLPESETTKPLLFGLPLVSRAAHESTILAPFITACLLAAGFAIILQCIYCFELCMHCYAISRGGGMRWVRGESSEVNVYAKMYSIYVYCVL